MSDGPTAIQVSPADLAGARATIEKFAAIIAALEATTEDNAKLRTIVNDDSATISSLRGDVQRLEDAKSLLETQLAGEHDLNTRLTSINEEKDAANIRLANELQTAKRERDDIGFKHLEVSEELAQANTALGKFRDLAASLSGTAAAALTAATATPSYSPPPVEPVLVPVEHPDHFPTTEEAKPVTDERAADTPPAPVTYPEPAPVTESPATAEPTATDPYVPMWPRSY